ncbi:MAG: ATPase AAA [Geobacteraceae bacterium]|nr:MAG: ATPase AAA [Geobacteraceae bacterium]
MENRPAYLKIWETLAAEKSMVFLAGPRQVGKTTLAKIIAEGFSNSLYCNWDIPEHRTRLLENPAFFTSLPRRDSSRPFIIFDEIHKYRDWKNYLKGVYDQFSEEYQFLITGSGRLDLYQKGGDSLAGRYLLFHLWPFTAGELGGGNRSLQDFFRDPLAISMDQAESLSATWQGLETLSGFPEPFLSGRAATYRRWSTGYSQRLIREDVRDLTEIRSVTNMETLYYLLPAKVGSPLSVPSLANDLKVTYNTVQNWLALFERFFLTFSLPTWTERIARAIHKERKVYLFDTPRITDPAARFENMVAIELWRAVTCWNAMGAGDFTLHFIRNKEQQEVDFLIAKERKPLLLIECKLAADQPSKALLVIQRALQVPAVQLVRSAPGYRTYRNGDLPVLVAPAGQWCARLPT